MVCIGTLDRAGDFSLGKLLPGSRHPFLLPAHLFPCHDVPSAVTLLAAHLFFPGTAMLIKHPYNYIQVTTTWLPLHNIWRLSTTTWTLLLRAPVSPLLSTSQSLYDTFSCHHSPPCQRRAVTEFPDEAGLLTLTLPMTLVNGTSSKNTLRGHLASHITATPAHPLS